MRSRTKAFKLTLHAVVVFWLKQTKQRNTELVLSQYHHKKELYPSQERTIRREPEFTQFQCSPLCSSSISEAYIEAWGLVPRYPRGLEGSGGEGGGDEGLKVEGGFTFGRLQGGFKGASRGLQGGLKPSEAEEGFERLEGGLKGASRGLEGGFKGLHLRKASRGLEGGLEGGFKGDSRGLQGGFTFGRLQGGLKEASRGLQGGLKPSEAEEGFERLEGGLKEA